MSDPRFFRHYLDMLDEQDPPTTATADIGGVNFTADKNAGTLTAKTNVSGVNLDATQDLNTGKAKSVNASTNIGGTDLKAGVDFTTAKKGAAQMSMDAPVAPNTTAGATYTQTGFQGQMAPTTQVRTSYKDTAGYIGTPGQTHTVTATQGVGFGGANKNIKPGQNWATSYTKT